MSAIKFGESLSKFMIPITLLEKFGSSIFITGIEISHMTRHSSKPNQLRNVNPVEVELGTSPSKNGKYTITKSKSSRLS